MSLTVLLLPVASFLFAPPQVNDSNPTDALLGQAAGGGDEVRGCCVLKADPIKCNFTNRGYCRVLATDNGLRFDFLEATPCRNVSMCPESRSR